MSANASAVGARKRRANRRNAKKSTGPRTAEGKARSSRNACTHAIFCSEIVLPTESRELFESLRVALIAEHRPQTITELFLVDRMAVGMWRMRRVQAAEALAHAGAAEQIIRLRNKPPEDDEDEEDYTRTYAEQVQARQNADEHDRDDNADERDEDAEEEEEFQPDLTPPAASVTTLHVMTPHVGDRQSELERFSLYEKRLEGTVHRCLRDLRKLRTPIKGEHEPDKPSPFLFEVSDEDATEPSPEAFSNGSSEQAGEQVIVQATIASDASKIKNEPTDAEPGQEPISSSPLSPGRGEGEMRALVQ